jgi:hypothetical protein
LEYFSKEDIAAFDAYGNLEEPRSVEKALAFSKARMEKAGVWKENQLLGLRFPVACVALEITQRCNLDCSLCYLSEYSEDMKDIPLEVVLRRVDQIYKHYGPHTDVQVTGGDPTLRNRDELEQIVAYVAKLNMRPTLMTNGIKATRALLERLAKVGLVGVAIHVDMTQERPGYSSEKELNEVRKEYIERVRGLPISVLFNTTVFRDNFHEIADTVAFLRSHADVVGFISFQLQADTGRGTIRERDVIINLDTVTAEMKKGLDSPVDFNVLQVGHHDCHNYGMTLSINGQIYDLYHNAPLTVELTHALKEIEMDRNDPVRTVGRIVSWCLRNPRYTMKGLRWVLEHLWRMKSDLIKARGKVHKLTVFAHNFMDAKSLECDRIESCSFMVMTENGPVSMCMHNAKRDDFLFQPIHLNTDKGEQVWDPLTGKIKNESPLVQLPELSKTAKMRRKRQEKLESTVA